MSKLRQPIVWIGSGYVTPREQRKVDQSPCQSFVLIGIRAGPECLEPSTSALNFRCLRLLLASLLSQGGLCFEKEFASSTAERICNAQNHGKCRHVFTSLDFPHVRPFDSCPVSQCFLCDTIRRSQCSHNSAECNGGSDLVCCCAKWPSSPSELLLHGQKTRIQRQLKPRYL